MRKPQHLGIACVSPIELDAEEVTAAVMGAALVVRHLKDKAASIEVIKDDGWRHQQALALAGVEAAESLSRKLAEKRQFKLPFRAWASGIGGAE